MSSDVAAPPARPPTNSRSSELEQLRRELDDARALASRDRGLLEAVLTHSPHGIIACDPDGKFILQNPAAQRIWAGSAPADDVSGWRKYRAFHEDGRPFDPEEWTMAVALRTREPVDAREFWIQRFDDSHGVLLGSAAPLFGPDGELLGALSIFADITSLKEAERERERLELQLHDRLAELDAANRRAAALQVLTAELSRAVSLEEISAAVVREARAALGSVTSFCYAFEPKTERLRLTAVEGVAPVSEVTDIPMTAPLPVAEAARTRQPVWIEDHIELGTRFPALKAVTALDPEASRVAALPLLGREGLLGCLAFSFSKTRTLGPEDRDFLMTIAAQCVPALERARLFEAEVEARRHAQQQQQRLELLVETGTLLASAQSYQNALDQLAKVLVPTVADWCAVDVLNTDGDIERVAVYHPDAAKLALANTVHERYPEDPNAPHGVAAVLREGRADWAREIPETLLLESAQDEEHLRIISELGLRSYICVPLLARGRVLGAVTLVHAESGRLYDESDVRFAEDLARRAAVAIDNAQLYEIAQRRERELSTLVDCLPQLVWFSAPDGTPQFFNKNWFEYTGVDPSAAAKYGWAGVIHPDDAAVATERWHHSLRTGEPYESMRRFRGRDGQYRWFLGRAMPLRDETGRIHKWFGTCTDIHEQRETEHALEEQASMLETINRVGANLAGELDTETLVQMVTDAATQLSGAQFGAFFYNYDDVVDADGGSYMLYTISGVPREHFSKFPMPRNTAVFAPTFAGDGIVRSDDITKDPRYGKNPPYRGMPAGHLPVRSYLAVPVTSRSGEVIGGLFFGHAEPGVFTNRAETLVAGLAGQAAIAMDNARLFREAQTLIDALERSNAELDQFAYVTSHDLKAPLRGIANLSQWIEEDLGDALTGEPRRQMELLRGRVHRMENLIDGILSYSRAGRVRSTPEQVDVGALLGEVAELLEGPVRIDVEPDMPTIHTERVPLQQVFLNLLGNAIKHARCADPHVQIRNTDRGDFWEFAVADNGPGIAPEFHDRIWGIFQTLNPRDKVESTGIGLSVVRKIVQSRGGRTWVDSTEGAGATFFFTWPKREKTS